MSNPLGKIKSHFFPRMNSASLATALLTVVNTSEFHATSTYAWTSDKPPAPFLTGEGLPGQVAKNKTIMNIEHIPENYIIVSGLGSGYPKNLLIVPLLLNKETIGVIELASFKKFDDQTEWTIKNLAKIIANSIVTKLRTFRGKK